MIRLITPERGTDAHGNGAYNAPRGSRRHKGIDFAAYPGSYVLSNVIGTVTKIGYPYDPTDPIKGEFRYVEITTPLLYQVRYFYVFPMVHEGDEICQHKVIGFVQNLEKVYPDITPHVHCEIKKDNQYYDPNLFFGEPIDSGGR